MLAAIKDHHWAYALRWFLHPDTRRTICIDQWESVGPGRGVFARQFGGWVDPNCLMFDKLECHQAIPWWTRPLPADPTHGTADRQVFGFLNQHFAGRVTAKLRSIISSTRPTSITPTACGRSAPPMPPRAYRRARGLRCASGAQKYRVSIYAKE